jgi:hypothetical protein
LNQKIVILGKIINMHKYANELIWITEIQIEEQFIRFSLISFTFKLF